MSDKKFTIGIETTADTSGANKTVEAIDAVIDKSKELEPKGPVTGFGGMLDGVPERAEESATALDSLADKTDNVKKSVEDLTEATKKQTAAEKDQVGALKQGAAVEKERRDSDRADQVAQDVRKVKQLQIAQAVGTVAQGLAGAAAKAREFADATRGVDKNLSGNLESVATGLESIGGAATGAAAGFAVGGPVGAIIGGIAGLAAPTLKKGVDDLFKSLDNLAEAKGVSAGLPAKIEAVKKALKLEDQAKQWEQLKNAIEGVGTAAEQNRIREEAADKAKLDSAKIAEDVAGAGGGDSRLATERRIAVEKEVSDRSRRREIQEAGGKVTAAQTSLQGKENQIADAKATGAAPDELKKLAEEADGLRKALKDAKLELETKKNTTGLAAGTEREREAASNLIGKKNEQAAAGDKTEGEINKVVGLVEGQLGDVANEPPVKAMIEKVRNLAEGGITGGEQNEVVGLVQQLITRIKKPNEDTAKLFQQLLGAVNASVDLQTRFAGQIDEAKRRIQTLETNAGRQRGY